MIAQRGGSDEHKQRPDRRRGRFPDSLSLAASQPAEPRRLASYPHGKRFSLRLIVWCATVLASSACAAKHDGLFSRFVKAGEPTVRLGDDVPAPSRQDLRDYTRKLRALQTKTTSKSSTLLPTIEGRDPALASALLRLALVESAEHHRLVAAAYRKAGVTDYAHRHYQRALRLAPCDSAAYEGLAQIWRDWGMPDVALGDAYRAVHCRPDSAVAHNTLGTVFQALGQTKNARRAFERALELDARGAFALNNLCYLWLQEGNARAARQTCERALALEPTMTVARTNLALAYVMQGDIPSAERQLLEHPDAVTGQFNVGMLRMSMGRYADAAQAFDVVVSERPASREARRRATQAHARIVAGREP